MERLNMATAIKRYNNIMNTINYEYNTIGTQFSENTENWNLRDMVAETDYILGTYYEVGHTNEEMRKYDYKTWLSEVNKLKRFVKTYAPFTQDMKCTINHLSKYDNK